ncbi:MAG: SDR family NAD(P)-dependent oxidoreductase [Pseudomonadota bacterium]
MRDWNGKRYWLVGASEGLGRSVAERLSRMGVTLVLSARSQERLAELANDLPGRAEVVPIDVSDPTSVKAAADAAGQIDGFVYLAGLYWPMNAADWNTDNVLAMLDVNLTGMMRCLGHVIPPMVEARQGHIVLTGSLSAYRGLPGAIGYSASKAATASLADTLDTDLSGFGIDVQIIHPGFIRTRLTDKNDFAMPQIMEPDAAAQVFVDHMQSGGFHRAFPAPFSWLFRLAPVMPRWLFRRLFR